MRTPRALFLVALSFTSTACISESEAGPKSPKAPPNTAPIRLRVDVRDAARRAFHSSLIIPVTAGPITLYYPKWLPGYHAPDGAITNLAGLTMRAGGKTLSWRRDDVDMYAFHVEVPSGVNELNVDFDYVAPSAADSFAAGATSTPTLAVLNWHAVLLYPAGRRAEDWTYDATLVRPKGWDFGTALGVASKGDEEIHFSAVNLVTLIDSPVATGAHVAHVAITPTGEATPHTIHLIGDTQSSLAIPKELVEQYTQLVRETGALIGSRHYSHYDFLVTLSDHLGSDGVEHHASSDNRIGERTFLEPEAAKTEAALLPHEFFHSWNGKFRRPIGLATPDYQAPMKTELLWVYEGLTEYYGGVLAARAGLYTQEELRADWAHKAAVMDAATGRTWQPLSDTAIAAPVLYSAGEEWSSFRRGVDFYTEGALIWLEVDVTIRTLTKGARSLDDFCHAFFGGEGGKPALSTYTLDDVVKALNAVAVNDWRTLFKDRLSSTSPRAPLGGISGGGYRLSYSESPSSLDKANEETKKANDFSFSLGFRVKEEKVGDVVIGSPAQKAGLSPGVKLVAVNGRKFKPELLLSVLSASKTAAAPIELLIENAEVYSTLKVDYHGGSRYPYLERDPSKPDMLSLIGAPRVATESAKPADKAPAKDSD
jgi:predicted metalloprotease with PDZ domain